MENFKQYKKVKCKTSLKMNRQIDKDIIRRNIYLLNFRAPTNKYLYKFMIKQ